MSAEYWVGPTIGEGAFAHVVYAVHKATERKVAIKVMEVPTASHAAREQRHHHQHQLKQKTAMILNERKILSLPELKASRWVVDLWAAFCGSASSSTRCLYFVMDLATGGDLAGLIHRGLRSPDRLSWSRSSVPKYVSQLIAAVDFLHSEGILHCDLKPENVLLDATTGQLRLADFGCALDTRQKEPQSSFPRGTARYSSPELLRAESPSTLTAAVDYWSVGCILHAMRHGRSPFDRGSEALTVRAIFGYVARGGSRSGSGTASDPPESATRDESKANKRFGDSDDDRRIENSSSTNPINASSPSKQTIENEDRDDDDDPLQLLSQALLAVVPDKRISAWKNKALPSITLESHDGDDNCEDGDTDPPPETGSQPSLSASVSKSILLPVPDWQDQVANATLRDGSLGWFVFQI